MQAKQTIVIIGAGDTGKAIAGCLACGHFHILLCDKMYTKAEDLVNELKDSGRDSDIEAMPCFFESAWEADIIILALDLQEQKEVAKIIKEVVNQKVLVCMFHAGSEKNDINPSPGCAVQALQELLPNTKIVSIFLDDLVTEHRESRVMNTRFILAGEDNSAIEIVSGMLGYAGIHAEIA